jgi:5-methyltetrahydrofolate--homocysteine methyltransferase
MNPLFQKLLLDGPIVTDGAWGTEFRAVGLEPGQCPDGWNLTRPDDVVRVAESYVDAGSRIILTNTFRSNRLALESYGLNSKTEAINRAGVELSLAAARQRALVFGSIGPARNLSTQQQPPNEELLFETFQEQARILANAGAQGIVLETFTEDRKSVV